MPRSETVLEPRKTPVQARSAASVEAVLQATLQVLLEVGKERLTTTRVAQRAGVSVGTLYQYFPNKSSLLRAVLKVHLDAVAHAVESVCGEQKGQPLPQMATALAEGFLRAKMKHAKSSAALYAISDDIDGGKISREMANRSHKAIAAMLASAPATLTTTPPVAAAVLQSVLAGLSRRILESPSPEKQLAMMQPELVTLTCAYLDAISSPRLS